MSPLNINTLPGLYFLYFFIWSLCYLFVFDIRIHSAFNLWYLQILNQCQHLKKGLILVRIYSISMLIKQLNKQKRQFVHIPSRPIFYFEYVKLKVTISCNIVISKFSFMLVEIFVHMSLLNMLIYIQTCCVYL